MNITKQILKESTIFNLDSDKKLSALIASIFSVLFSLSIVLELANIVNGIVLIFLTIFTVLFLITNERIKVQQLKNVYKGNRKSIIPFMVTFVISILLSSIGIYLWTNKSFDMNKKINTEKVIGINEVKEKFLNKNNELLSKEFTSTNEFTSLTNDLEYWKTKTAASLDERNSIREHIKEIETKIDNSKNLFNIKIQDQLKQLKEIEQSEISLILNNTNNATSSIERNNSISMIFMIMILITELGIVVLNKDIAKFENNISELTNNKHVQNYLIARKVLESIYLTKNIDNIVNLKGTMYSPALHKTNWDDNKKFAQVKALYNLFINLGILGESTIKDNIPHNSIVLDEKNALAKFDKYYEKLLIL